MRAATRTVLVPAAAFFAAFSTVPCSPTLYDASRCRPGAAALFFAGSVWIPLYALYAMSRTRAIAVGELLSLPLFTALLAAWVTVSLSPSARGCLALLLCCLCAFLGDAQTLVRFFPVVADADFDDQRHLQLRRRRHQLARRLRLTSSQLRRRAPRAPVRRAPA